LRSSQTPPDWDDGNAKLSDSYCTSPWIEGCGTVLPEDLGVNLEPHLQAIRYALPHPSQHFTGGDVGVDYFPFGAQNWFPEMDICSPQFNQEIPSPGLSNQEIC
jgi:hypothetical protein